MFEQVEEYIEDLDSYAHWTCSGCGKKEGSINEEYSLGIYAGRYHAECWDVAPYRKEGREGFDPSDAGEAYDEEDY